MKVHGTGAPACPSTSPSGYATCDLALGPGGEPHEGLCYCEDGADPVVGGQVLWCRCGWAGDGPHPCHGRAYSCRAPASHRFYDARPAAVAGVQVKLQVSETWACDACWAKFAGAA